MAKTKKTKTKKIKRDGRKRRAVDEARERVLKVARRKGFITNQQANEIGGWEQSWYHLDAMARDGLLKKDGFNTWRPRR